MCTKFFARRSTRLSTVECDNCGTLHEDLVCPTCRQKRAKTLRNAKAMRKIVRKLLNK